MYIYMLYFVLLVSCVSYIPRLYPLTWTRSHNTLLYTSTSMCVTKKQTAKNKKNGRINFVVVENRGSSKIYPFTTCFFVRGCPIISSAVALLPRNLGLSAMGDEQKSCSEIAVQNVVSTLICCESGTCFNRWIEHCEIFSCACSTSLTF